MSPFRRHNSQKTQNINFMMGTASFPKIPTTNPQVKSDIVPSNQLNFSVKESFDSKKAKVSSKKRNSNSRESRNSNHSNGSHKIIGIRIKSTSPPLPSRQVRITENRNSSNHDLATHIRTSLKPHALTQSASSFDKSKSNLKSAKVQTNMTPMTSADVELY